MKAFYLLLALALPAAPTATAQGLASSTSLKNTPPHSPKTTNELYRAAEEAARRNEPRLALRQLKQAVASGYIKAGSIEENPIFAPLHNQSAWPRLLNQARVRQQQHEATFDPQLLALIKKIHYQDQHYRRIATAAERQYGVDSPQAQAADREQSKLDPQLIRQVDSLIAIHGYPGKRLVGGYQTDVAFFVIQHNPDEKYLPLLTAAAEKGDIRPSELAIFTDRIRARKGEKQIYGSQLGPAVKGKYTLDPIEDEPNVNGRRAAVGLEPLEDYLSKYYNIAYQVPTATHNPNPPELYTQPHTDKSPVEPIGGYEAIYARLQYPAEATPEKHQR
ncbi:DUF6624 domain-containing protein [Hymenobacter actinosclerus]|uniref:Uncharacterized protein n=1 Tax=Hymenobacter actinosclerus TaxID=82805 RepID=A0A1I0B4W2_9BACT|nr:DUF6624 domain-containing protein [Hymenobacter actinosclerus]SET01903.1 hypothetical protein SAMN04487998_0945 [Hymenobacter actinosclerus]